MINSLLKGKRNERLWRDVLISYGFQARRGAQYSGNNESPDVISNLPFHWEVKAVEKLNLWKAMDQAITDSSGSVNVPVVAYHKSNKDWLVILKADDFLKMVKRQETQP